MAEVPLPSVPIPEAEKQRPMVLVVDDERVIADTPAIRN